MLEAFIKLSEQQKSFQKKMKMSATISKPPAASVVDQITESDSKPGTSHESDFQPNRPNHQNLNDAMDTELVPLYHLISPECTNQKLIRMLTWIMNQKIF